jgi:hypothetical protein
MGLGIIIYLTSNQGGTVPGATVLDGTCLRRYRRLDSRQSTRWITATRTHTSETISVELPAFDSPQHVIVLELKVHDASSHIILATKLHLRYLELSDNR